LLSVNESYAPQTLLTLNFSLPEVQYAQPAARLNFNEQIVRRLGSVSGVQAASLVTYVPTRMEDHQRKRVFGRGTSADAARRSAQRHRGDNHIELLQYAKYRAARRPIAERYGRSGSPQVAVISESLARRYFPGENPLGRHIKAGKAEAEGEG